ncbi:MAG: protein translocase subunit SecDF [Bacteroides sp.]|nr:protein translocase subunit SecDF [Bacteroides sp.]MCM1448590.1 protein translocase subunit SecDF [Bacteroides sp.]MCM1515930.1 protein translocase subunit SecDF [Paraprevotella sp.]
MQNKGFVKAFAVLLTLVCAFYLSFSVVTSHYDKCYQEKLQTEGKEAADHYMDSLNTHNVYLGSWTLKECREMGIGLGLDLKGGMNVILEVSVPDVIKALADHKEEVDGTFRTVVETSAKEATESQSDFITLFVKNFKKAAPERSLAELFATQQLRGKVTPKSTDKEVEAVLRAELKSAIDNSYNVLRTRIDRFGVVQPNIQALEGQEGRIMVEMPGVKEPERVRKLLQGSANLEFWETYNSQDITPFLAQLDGKLAAALGTEVEAAADTTASTAQEADTVKTDLAAALSGNKTESNTDKAEIERIRKQHPLLSRLQLTQGAYGCIVGFAHKRDMEVINELLETPEAKSILPSDLQLKWGVKGMGEGEGTNWYELYAIRVTERNGRAPLEGDVITDAKDDFDQHGRPCVSMQMNVDGARRWGALTKANLQRSVAIVLDNNVYSAPTVQTAITDGNSQITGHFTAEDTRDLANVLKSGKMPAPAKIVSEEIVGPTLGAESIRLGIWSCAIAFVVLMIYMIAMYGTIPGMVANGALLLNLFFTAGILTSFQASLTMSGIAGMVLTLGMAVDANVLIYERTKEELKTGKKLREALNAGYSNAFSAIFDSNLTSIITGIILYNFGTGPIKGFATTLIIGIVVSFFTAVFMTRLVYTSMLARGKWQNLKFKTPVGNWISFKNPNYKFLAAYKKSFIIFGALALVAVAGMKFRGFSKSIDFTGGRNFVVMFDKQVTAEKANALLGDAFDGDNINAIAIGTDGNTLRISTNYRIDEDGMEVDSEIESKLFEVLKEGGLLASDLTLETFINRDVRDGGSIISSQKVGPAVAEDITYGAIWSVILAIIAIFIYILVRFRNIAFSIGSIVALMSDVILILGAYALCWGWMPFSMEIDQTFIGAILTAIGYSINDKVVVFDRIREELGLHPNQNRFEVFNRSVNSTLNRTINTSVSTFIVLAVIFMIGIIGGGASSIISFSFAMILGVIFGTFSSIFVAAPVAYLWMNKSAKKDK